MRLSCGLVGVRPSLPPLPVPVNCAGHCEECDPREAADWPNPCFCSGKLSSKTRIVAIWGCVIIAPIIWIVPQWLSSKPIHAPRNSCIQNLKHIEGAKNVWLIEKNKTTNDVPTLDDLVGEAGYIKEMPKCSMGGVYTLGRIDENPTCSIPGHTLW